MCGRYALTTPADVLAKLFGIPETALATFLRHAPLEPRYNLAPTQTAPVVRTDDDQRALAYLRWGLIPSWAKDPAIGSRMINARSESAAEKPAFRSAFARRRCLVPANGFFEWRSGSGPKQPFFIHRHDRQPMAFAGLWERWKLQESEPVETFTILTTDANEALRPLHDRMPVILAAEAIGPWLDPAISEADRLRPLLRPAPEDLLAMYAVSRRVNGPAVEDPSLLEEVVLPDEPDARGEPDQQTLF